MPRLLVATAIALAALAGGCGARAAAPEPVLSNTYDPSTEPAKPEHTSITGTILDTDAKEPAVGVTIVASSPSLQGEQVVISDDKGAFEIPLVPGTYLLTYYYNDTTTKQPNIVVRANRATRVAHRISTQLQQQQSTIKISAP